MLKYVVPSNQMVSVMTVCLYWLFKTKIKVTFENDDRIPRTNFIQGQFAFELKKFWFI